MIFSLWASWFMLFVIARVLGGLAMVLVFAIMVVLPGDRNVRFARMANHNARGLSGIAIGGAVVSLVGVYFLSQWWFTFINYSPVSVAVFGSVGIAAITWVATFVRKRQRLIVRLKAYGENDSDDHDDDLDK